MPEDPISDNYFNFVGADQELQKLTSMMCQKSRYREGLISQGIKWNFNLPSALHFGAVFETMNATKTAILAILGNTAVNNEELITTFTGAESLINSRPSTYQSGKKMTCP